MRFYMVDGSIGVLPAGGRGAMAFSRIERMKRSFVPGWA